jgi:hypothetical protein
LPEIEAPSQQINLGAAWMNRAHAVMRRHERTDGAAQSRAAAMEALKLVQAHERENSDAAEVGVKARHILCRALGTKLNASGAHSDAERSEAWAAATDAVDDGLALARHWAKQGNPLPLTFVGELFRFGAQTYLTHQPHFLAEFVLEQLDPQTSEDPLPWHPGLHGVALQAVKLALRDLEQPQVHLMDAPNAERRIESLHDLYAAAARLEEMEQAQPAKP